LTWWDLVREAGDTFLVSARGLAAFVYLALEESGLLIPVPGDFLLLALGACARCAAHQGDTPGLLRFDPGDSRTRRCAHAMARIAHQLQVAAPSI
jgi:hypothetical protein